MAGHHRLLIGRDPAPWDAAIIESSRAIGCTVLLSEDLNDGQDYAGVRVTNPFAT